MKTFAERLKDARIKAGISQGELSRLCGVSPACIARYESGERYPRTEKVGQLANALKIHPEQLLGTGSHLYLDITYLSDEDIATLMRVYRSFKRN